MTATHSVDTATRTAPGEATPREARALVRRAQLRDTKMRAKMGRLAETDVSKGRRFQYGYLGAFSAKIAALVAAEKRLKTGLSDAELIALAKNLNPWVGTNERVNMYPEPKPGGYRPITSFGIQNKALQILVERAAKPFIRIHPAQYDALGHGGPPAACRRLLELLGQGYVHVVVADVAGNFNSLSAAGIKEMIPLPPAVIEAVVLARGLNINPSQRRYDYEKRAGDNQRATAPKAPRGPCRDGGCASPPLRGIARHAQSGTEHLSRLKESLRKGRRGIPQGLTGSSLYSAAIHEPMVRNISRVAPAVHYTDNFYAVAKTGDEALLVAKALKIELQRSPAGPLLWSECKIVDARHGFAALGYLFKVKNGRALIRVPRHKLEDCRTKFLGMFEDVALGNMTRAEVERYLDGWCAAHRLWPHWRLWRKLLVGRLDQHFPPPSATSQSDTMWAP